MSRVRRRLNRYGPALALALAGCSQQLRPIFDEQAAGIAWPPPPAQARIRYLGQLRGADDLKPPPKPFAALGQLLLGPPEPQRFYGPRSAVCVDDGRRVCIADPGGRCVHLLDLQDRSYRKVTEVGGAPLLKPVDVCAGPAGSFYLCDSEDAAVHRLSARDGQRLESPRLPEDIQRPVAVYFDAQSTDLYVVDVGAHDIKVLAPDGTLRRLFGRRGSAPGEFNFPCDIAADAETLWVVDAGNSRVQGLTRAGEPIAALGQVGDAPGDLALPKSVAVDSDRHLYVLDARFENVQVFDRSGQLLLFFGQEGGGPGEFWLPSGVFIDQVDRLWVCDTYNARVQVFQYVPERQTGQEGQPVNAPAVEVTP